jgi:hypothetical protein
MQVVIGCDGGNSVIGDFLELKPPKLLSKVCAVRGFTNYQNGHGFGTDGIRQMKGQVMLGRATVTETLVYWTVLVQVYPQGAYTKINRRHTYVCLINLKVIIFYHFYNYTFKF